MAFVQQINNDVNATAQTSVNATLGSAVGANRVVLWIVFYISNTVRTVTMSGGSGVTYTEAGSVTCTGGTTNQQYHWGYAKVPSSQSLTVTATLSGNGDYPGIYLQERDDLDYTTPATANEDAGRRTNAAGAGSSLTSGLTPTLAYPDCFIVGLTNNYSLGSTPTAGAGWTDHGEIWDYGTAGDDYGRVISKTVSSTAAVQSEFVSVNSNFSDILVFVYKLSTGGASYVWKQYSNGAFQTARLLESAISPSSIKARMYSANGAFQANNFVEVASSNNRMFSNGTIVSSKFIEKT